jgi:hypothetical protein
MSQRINTTDLILTTPQWSSFCASEKGVKRKSLPDFVIDKREIVVDPVSNKKFYKCRMVSEAEIYKEVKNNLM